MASDGHPEEVYSRACDAGEVRLDALGAGDVDRGRDDEDRANKRARLDGGSGLAAVVSVEMMDDDTT